MDEYILTEDRSKFILDNFFEWSFNKDDDYVPDKEKFKELTHPCELHYLADIHNWDDGSLILEWILESELCSRSTANLLFWKSSPVDHLDYELTLDEGEVSYIYLDGIRVIRNVMNRYKNNNFSEINIEYDPKSNLQDMESDDPKWAVPEGLYDVISGTKLIIE